MRIFRFQLVSNGSSQPGSWFWLTLSLLVGLYYGWLAVQQGFSGAAVVQDDARQHVFWMARFLDPQLFPHDLIADYLQSVAPPGYTACYRVLASLGLPPLVASKVLPPILGLITTLYAFRVALEILPVPAAAFLANLILNQSLWLKNDLVSATPRAFLYPLFLAFLYYLLRRVWWPCLLAIALLGVIYPHFVLVAIALLLLRLGHWKAGRVHLSRKQWDYSLFLSALAIAVVVLLPYKLGPDLYGPIITVTQARLEPEFGPLGRSFFFDPNPLVYWLTGERSGLLFLPQPPLLLLGLALPLLLHFPERFPLGRQVQPKIWLLVQLLLASGGLFLLAHLFLFQLHLPSRYIHHSLRLVLSLAAGMTLAIALDAWFRSGGERAARSARILGLVLGLFLLGLGLFPFLPSVPRFYQDWIGGRWPELYTYLQQQPQATLVASISLEASNIPTFAQRSTLVGREYALPYHTGYYRQIRQRTLELLQAHYSADLAPLQRLIQKYGVDLLVVDRDAFTVKYLRKSDWLWQYQPAFGEAIAHLESGQTPALAQLLDQCAATVIDGPAIVSAACIVQITNHA